MTIIPPLPFTLQNGTTADASQVQADLDAIVNNVNAHASPGIGSGTVYRGAVALMTAQALSASPQLIPLASTTIDTDSIFSLSSPTRLTVPANATRVRILVRVRLDLSFNILSGDSLKLYKNGVSLTDYWNLLPGDAVLAEYSAISRTLVVTPGDYFEVAIAFLASPTGSVNTAASFMEMEILG